MMKHFFITLLYLFCINPAYAQVFSSTISDAEIESVILSALQVESGKREGKIKVERSIVDWKEILNVNIDSFQNMNDGVDPDAGGIQELFTEADYDYFRLQIKQQKRFDWTLPGKSIKIVGDCSHECYRYALPLFNVSRNVAIIYKEEIYSSMAGCGIISAYTFNNNQWELSKSILVWLM